MSKMVSIILFGIILGTSGYTQQKTFGYKISGNGDIISDLFLIQDGFVLDSATSNNKTYLFEYNTDGKLKRDINFITYTVIVDPYSMKNVPGCRDYFYNERGDVDSIAFGQWNDSSHVYDYTGDGCKYFYDKEEKLILKKTYINFGSLSNIEENSYDSYGNLILNRMISGHDTTNNFREYDSQNRLKVLKSIHNHNSSYDQYIFKYDSAGNISRTFQPVGYFNLLSNYLFKFDESGKVIDEIHQSFNSSDSTWENNYELSFNYNKYGEILKMGETSWFHYNSDGNLDTLVNPPSLHSNYLENRATLIDSYGNQIILPDYSHVCYFYYSKLITNIKNDVVKNNSFSLSQNYPNPFNPNTKINYFIPQTCFVTLKVYDLLGKEVATIVNKEQSIGNYEINFNGSNLSSGVYFYRIQAGSFSNTKKLILLK